MKVESIAECSPWSITFDLHLAIIIIEINFLFSFESGRFTQVLLYLVVLSQEKACENHHNVSVS